MEEVQKVVHGPTVESQKWSFLGHQNRHGAQHGFSCVCKSRFLNDWHNKWKHSVTISRFDHKKGHFLSSQIGNFQSDKKGQGITKNIRYLIFDGECRSKREMVRFGPLKKRVKKGWKKGPKWVPLGPQTGVYKTRCKNVYKHVKKRARCLGGFGTFWIYV